MIPATFTRTYLPTARTVALAVPHLRTDVILAQWAIESGWGTSALAVNWHNLAGIRWYGRAAQVRQIGGTPGKAGTGFAGYASFDAFAADYEYVIRLPYYAAVRASLTAQGQAQALGASPWDAGHYLAGGIAGGSLLRILPLVQASLPTVTPVTVPPTAPRTYVVRAGDTLWRIAIAYYRNGAYFGRIAAANHIAAPYIIRVGQRLVIP